MSESETGGAAAGARTEYDFDVIVVGGGVAGAVCAYLLAQQGREVLLVERGAEPGSKNLSGGVFYCRIMEEIFPGFVENAPIERHITRNCLSFLNPTSFVNVDYWDARLAEPVNAVTVLRAKLDLWLAEQCEEAGVTVMPGIKVEGLVREGNQIVGIRAGEDELTAKVVVAADGINSFISQDAGIRAKEPMKNLAVGVKSVIKLSEEKVRDRFHLTDDEGAAYAVVGDCTQGVAGGGFLYSIGILSPSESSCGWTIWLLLGSPPRSCMIISSPIQRLRRSSRVESYSNTVAIWWPRVARRCSTIWCVLD